MKRFYIFYHPVFVRALPGLALSLCTTEVSGATERTGGWLPYTTHSGNDDKNALVLMKKKHRYELRHWGFFLQSLKKQSISKGERGQWL